MLRQNKGRSEDEGDNMEGTDGDRGRNEEAGGKFCVGVVLIADRKKTPGKTHSRMVVPRNSGSPETHTDAAPDDMGSNSRSELRMHGTCFVIRRGRLKETPVQST